MASFLNSSVSRKPFTLLSHTSLFALALGATFLSGTSQSQAWISCNGTPSWGQGISCTRLSGTVLTVSSETINVTSTNETGLYALSSGGGTTLNVTNTSVFRTSTSGVSHGVFAQ